MSSQILGLAIEPLATMSDDEVVAAVAPNLQYYIDGEIRMNARRRRRA